jgi:HD-GYP domain-containing protein (c-di-GMP phosphodiesterase class II)
MDLIELRQETLVLGMSLSCTLRDESGAILLAKGHRIESAQQLAALKSRTKIFVEIDQSKEGVRAMMSGIYALNQAGAPIKDFSKYLNLKKFVPPEDKFGGTLIHRWGDVEAKLSGLLGSAASTADFEKKLQILGQRIESQFMHDGTAAQFLLFNRAVSYFNGYSVMHSLLCATLAHSLAATFGLSEDQRHSLVCAALTMNVAMTRLQDTLTVQHGAPSSAQREEIDAHPGAGRQILIDAGVTDPDWLAIVAQHHAQLEGAGSLAAWPPAQRMTKILQTVDRYTAAMSPRKSRSGRTARDSVRSVVVQTGSEKHDEVGMALVRILGLCPPGTYVKLNNGETAVVIRRGVKPAEPLVASVLNRNDEPIAEPRLHDIARIKSLSIESTLTATSVRVNLNLETMVRLIPRRVEESWGS